MMDSSEDSDTDSESESEDEVWTEVTNLRTPAVQPEQPIFADEPAGQAAIVHDPDDRSESGSSTETTGSQLEGNAGVGSADDDDDNCGQLDGLVAGPEPVVEELHEVGQPAAVAELEPEVEPAEVETEEAIESESEEDVHDVHQDSDVHDPVSGGSSSSDGESGEDVNGVDDVEDDIQEVEGAALPTAPDVPPRNEPPVPAPRRSSRERKVPDFYGAYVSHRSQPCDEPEWSQKAAFLMTMAKDEAFKEMQSHICHTILNIVSYK